MLEVGLNLNSPAIWSHHNRKILRVLPEPLGENVHPVPLIKLDGDTKERDVVLIRLLLPDPNS